MSDPVYAAGLIGAGKVAHRHARAIEKVERINLTAASDIHQNQLEKVGDTWGIPSEHRYSDHQDMLETEELDVISICTPTFLHAKHTLDAASLSNTPDVIWCEKPIATCVDDAHQMIKQCDAVDIELVINHNRRFLDGAQTLRRLINEQNLLGQIQTLNTLWVLELMRNGSHLIDMLIYLLDTKVHQIIGGHLTDETGVTEKADMAKTFDGKYTDVGGAGMVIMEDGTFATIDCTAPRTSPRLTFDFLGEKGRLQLDWQGEQVQYWRFTDEEEAEQLLRDLRDVAWSDLDEMFVAGATHIVDLLDGSAENLSPGEEAAHVLEILVGLYASHYTNGKVTLPLESPLRQMEITSW